MASDEKAQIAIRLTGSLLSRLDTYKDRVKSGLPGMEFTRADAVRVLLEQALAEQGLPGDSPKGESKPRRRSA
jgi:hypothetical protein